MRFDSTTFKKHVSRITKPALLALIISSTTLGALLTRATLKRPQPSFAIVTELCRKEARGGGNNQEELPWS